MLFPGCPVPPDPVFSLPGGVSFWSGGPQMFQPLTVILAQVSSTSSEAQTQNAVLRESIDRVKNVNCGLRGAQSPHFPHKAR